MLNYNFKLLWTGKLISQLGDKFYGIALAWWILQKTNSTISMGLFMFASVVPGIIFGMFTGAVCDRFNRKRIMVMTDAVRGGLVLTITCLSFLDILAIWQVFLIGISLSIASAFFDPASQAILPELVPLEDLKKANSMCQLVGGVCSTLGPMLGALTVSIAGTNAVFLANSMSFLIAMFLTLFMRYTKVAQRDLKIRTSMLQDIRDGLQYILHRRNMISSLIVIGAAHFFVGSLSVTLPFLASKLSGVGVNNLGLFEMLMGIGLLLGATYGRLKKKVSAHEQTLMKLMRLYAMCFFAISIAQYFEIKQVVVYLPILFLVGAIIANASIFWQLLLQNNTPADMMGRVFGIATLIGNASLPIAYGIVGIVLNYCDITWVMLTSGIFLMIIAVFLGSFLRTREIKALSV